MARTSGPYTVLTLVSLAHATTHMYSVFLPLTFPFIIQEFRLDYTTLGAMMGVATLVGGLLQLVFGYIPQYISRKALIGGGNFLLGMSTIWGSVAPNFAHYAAARWMAAIVTSPQHPVGYSMIANRFTRSLRGLALAVNYAGGNAGTLIVPFIAALLIGAIGWRQSMLIFGIPQILVGTLVVALIRDPAATEQEKAETGAKFKAMLVETRSLLRNRTFALLMAASLVSAGGRGLGIVVNFIPPYLSDPVKGLGLSSQQVGVLYTLLLLGSILGPLALGRLSDHFGLRKPVVIVTYLASAVGVTALIALPNDNWALATMIFLFGFAVFSEASLVQAFMSDMARAGSRDIVFGIYFAGGFGVSSLWVVFQGWLVDHYGFPAMFVAMAVSYVLAALLCLGAREPR